MHKDGIPQQGIAGEDLYHGDSLLKHLGKIKRLVKSSKARTLLDYGSGKGRGYTRRDFALPSGETIPSIAEYLGIDAVRCYDPAVPEHWDLPETPSDIVISTDALEHCPESDLPWIVEEMFDLANAAVFANVASYPAKKELPSGENAHATQRRADWWDALLKDIATRHPNIRYHFEIVQYDKNVLTLFRLRRRIKVLRG